MPDNAQYGDSKVCPACAERVNAAAAVCRYCGHRFTIDGRRQGMLLLLGGVGGGALAGLVALVGLGLRRRPRLARRPLRQMCHLADYCPQRDAT
jgi:hypothetical protein